jgi:energy-coupling factor transporter ATP-binding protein EcfA2
MSTIGSDAFAGFIRPSAHNTVETQYLARIAREAPRVAWDEFLEGVLHWKSGEHFALIGPTGQGKTTMLLNLLQLHPYVTLFATKPEDDSLTRLVQAGYVRFQRWKSVDADEYPRRILWPNARKLGAIVQQREVFHEAFEKIYLEGGWTVVIDETWYVTNILKLGLDIKLFLLQARALGISLVCATQRPASVAVEVYDQSTHLMFWRDNDEANLDRLSGISYRSASLIRRIVSNLDAHQVLYVNTRTGRMCRTRCPAPEEVTSRDHA